MTEEAVYRTFEELPSDSNDMVYIILDGHGYGDENAGAFLMNQVEGSTQRLFDNEISDALAGTEYGRLVFIVNSSSSAGIAGNLDLNGKAIAIASQWYDGASGLRQIPKYMSPVLDENPYVSVDSLIAQVRAHRENYDREPFVVIYNDNVETLQEFFFFPSD